MTFLKICLFDIKCIFCYTIKYRLNIIDKTNFKGGSFVKYFKKLVGKNVYLSPLNEDDAQIYVKWFNDMSLTDRLHQSHKIYSTVTEKEWILNSLSKGLTNFAIVKVEDDTLIGNCGIMDIDNISGCATVGIFIGEEENRGKGYGKEALQLLVDFGFNSLNLKNINLSVFDFNKSAIKCYEKVGFKEYGRRHSAYFCNGKYHDIIYMEILSDYLYKQGGSL